METNAPENTLSSWVRKLIGKLGVPYNRRLGVRGSSHPLNLCCRIITPRSGKQRFPRPFGFYQLGMADCRFNQLVFLLRNPGQYKDSAHFGLWQFWPAHFWFHKILCV